MILLDGVTLNFDDLLKLAIAITGIWGFVKVIMEIIKAVTARHDREQAWDKAVKDIEVDRKSLKDEFNSRLDEQDARIQQMFAMLCMCLRAQDAILEALVEKDIGNGEIKAMHRELKDFIMKQVEV